MTYVLLGFPDNSLRTVTDPADARAQAIGLGRQMALGHIRSMPKFTLHLHSLHVVGYLYSSLPVADRDSLFDATDRSLTVADHCTDYRRRVGLLAAYHTDLKQLEDWASHIWVDVLQGTAIGIAQAADELAASTGVVLNHRGASLEAFIAEVLDGGPGGAPSTTLDQEVPFDPITVDSLPPYHQAHENQRQPNAAALVPMSKAIDDWALARQLSRSEASRQTTSARQFARWLELTDAPVSQLELIGTDASLRFHDQDHTLKPRGQRGRIKHVRDFLNYVRTLGVNVPKQTSGEESEEATDA